MAEPLQVEVVSADRLVWEGEATMVIARTTEGDVGVMPRHESFLAGLVACVVEIVTDDGRRERVAIDGGFIAVHDNRVSILSQAASLDREISPDEARRELDKLTRLKEAGDMSDDDLHRYHLVTAQLKLVDQKQTQNH